MNGSPSYLDYLNDMLDATEKAEAFTLGMTFDEFVQDEKTIFAVIRTLEILGEASGKIPASIKQKNTHIPWKEMKGMRNKLIHDYMGVNKKVVWNTVKKDLPAIKEPICKLIKELNS